MSEHTCHLPSCDESVPRRWLMCKEHWFMVPRDIRREVNRTYQPGQEKGEVLPSEEWHEAADKAIEAVARKEAAHG